MTTYLPNPQEPAHNSVPIINDTVNSTVVTTMVASPSGDAKPKKGLRQASIELGNKIRQALSGKQLSTRKLANLLEENQGRVYRQCRRLEKEHVLERSQEVQIRFLCIDHMQVLTEDNHGVHDGHEIRPFRTLIGVWEVVSQMPQQKAVS